MTLSNRLFVIICGIISWNGVAFHQSISNLRLRQGQQQSTSTTREGESNAKQVLSRTSSSSTELLSSSSAWMPEHRRRRRKIHKDVVIVGGGLAGLSAALYLSQIDPERQITILDKHDGSKKTSIATFAAAGMLAPQSERLPKGDYLDLCTESKKMFPGFADLVECMAQEAGEEGRDYLGDDEQDGSGLEPWNIGYVASGGFLAPAFAGDSVATWAPPEDSKGTATWLDATQVRELEPNLNPNVVGGWWFPEDASVDARRLARSLRAGCVGAGVQILSGPNYEVSSLDLENGVCNGLWLKTGKYISTKTILVANGAWMRNLLPVPIEAHKGQSLSLRMPKDRPPLLRRVLFGQDSYIVPKADGRIVIGATVEAGNFDPKVTPAGIMHILSYALEIIPGLADLPLEETWAGLRPTTPDKGPILGETPWSNLYLAGGYWRNGVLLAPKTGELMASLIAGQPLNEQDKHFLKAFSWDRFTSEEGGAVMAANARYAASMYPVHSRKSGTGVAAAVGTELGSYSTAVSAKEERKRDRENMFGDIDDSFNAFELAASMGKQDGSAFSFGEDTPVSTTKKESYKEENVLEEENSPRSEDIQSALEEEQSDLQTIYQSIRENKSKQELRLDDKKDDDQPDPGFRIYHIDENGDHHEVPPYTPPREFLESIKARTKDESTPRESSESSIIVEATNEETFDGYSSILKAAAQDDDIRNTMREARIKNRGSNDDDERAPESEAQAVKVNGSSKTVLETDESENESSDLAAIYQQIRDQKAASPQELNENDSEERPDPGFRVYYVDDEGKDHEVPPYTAPGDFMQSLKNSDASPEDTRPKAAKVEPESDGFLQSQQSLDDKLNLKPKRESSYKVEEVVDETASIQEANNGSTIYNEKTYDGYEAIIQANGSTNRDDELNAMREARIKNRLGQGESIEESELSL